MLEYQICPMDYSNIHVVVRVLFIVHDVVSVMLLFAYSNSEICKCFVERKEKISISNTIFDLISCLLNNRTVNKVTTNNIY